MKTIVKRIMKIIVKTIVKTIVKRKSQNIMKTIVALFTFTSEFLNGKTYLLGNKSILLFKNLALYILNEKS